MLTSIPQIVSLPNGSLGTHLQLLTTIVMFGPFEPVPVPEHFLSPPLVMIDFGGLVEIIQAAE